MPEPRRMISPKRARSRCRSEAHAIARAYPGQLAQIVHPSSDTTVGERVRRVLHSLRSRSLDPGSSSSLYERATPGGGDDRLQAIREGVQA